jgi:hypothetical protein
MILLRSLVPPLVESFVPQLLECNLFLALAGRFAVEPVRVRLRVRV